MLPMRSFIAIELSPEIKDSLAQIQSHLKYSGADAKWTSKEDIHLTMKFLGEIDGKKLEQVKRILDEIGKLSKPFEIRIKDIGAFPTIDFPRVIWVGLDKGAEESAILAGRIDEALSKIGFEKESRPFAAHLTIGRVRSPKNKEALKEKIMSYGCQPCDEAASKRRAGLNLPYAIADTIMLFQSTLTPHGPIYTKLHEAKLK
jgi:2'-5' RNA ligase